METETEQLVRMMAPKGAASVSFEGVDYEPEGRFVHVPVAAVETLKAQGYRGPVPESLTDEQLEEVKARREYLVERWTALGSELADEQAKLEKLTTQAGDLQDALIAGTADGDTAAALAQEREARDFSVRQIDQARKVIEDEIVRATQAIQTELRLRDTPRQVAEAEVLRDEADHIRADFVEAVARLPLALRRHAEIAETIRARLPLADPLSPLNLTDLTAQIEQEMKAAGVRLPDHPSWTAQWMLDILAGPAGEPVGAAARGDAMHLNGITE